jgi:FkbM family methyltransferase
LALSEATYDGSVISPPFESYSQNGEDVVLWRALRGVAHGRYIEVGANHPSHDSISMAFYARGWTGITVEPDPQFAALQREFRPGDLVVEAAVTPDDGGTVILHVVDGTGLSTLDETRARVHARAHPDGHDVAVATRRLDSILAEAGWKGQDIHFMSVDTEGSERGVLESLDLTSWRPWVLLVEATEPNTTRSTRGDWEDIVTGAGYEFCLFDGLSCFYVSSERSQQLREALSYSACVLDNYTPPALRKSEQRAVTAQALAEQRAEENRALVDEVVRWRGEAVSRWAEVMAQIMNAEQAQALQTQVQALEVELQSLQQQRAQLDQEVGHLRHRVMDLEGSTSWRVTKPLRTASGMAGWVRRGGR